MEVVETSEALGAPSSTQSTSEPGLPLVTHDLPWIEKYRPKSLSELIAHEEIVNIRMPPCLSSSPSHNNLSFSQSID
jgi:hypothetical protein